MQAIDTRTVERDGETYRISVYRDADAECPSDWEGWRLVSFGRRHRAYEAPERYCKGLDARGDPIPAHIGLSRKLEAGTAFWLSYFEHGLCRWSLMGEGPPCRWDSVRVAGILLWERPPPDLAVGYQAREADARRFLETYTAWANGDIYGYQIERITTCDGCDGDHAESVDCCWGYFGLDNCLSEAMAAVEAAAAEGSPAAA